MILSALLAATFTFTATATGVEKGTPVEFFVAGDKTDRDYEAMFVLTEPIDAFFKRLDSALPRGTPVTASECRLWPTGCRVTFDPPFERFVKAQIPEGWPVPVPIYTGGSRQTNGVPDAVSTMPAAVFSSYSLPQAPIVFNDPIDQGSAYGKFTAAVQLKKGDRVTFKMTVDEKSLPKKLDLTAEKGNLPKLLNSLKSAASGGEIDARVSFAGDLTIEEATAVAQALSVIDSSRVKLNGAHGLFYRAFLPLEKWRDRQERLQQPFELHLMSNGVDKLLFIEEDWTVEGNDPKLTPRRISFEQACSHPQTDTCFVYTSKTQLVSRISMAMNKLAASHVRNWYVYSDDNH